MALGFHLAPDLGDGAVGIQQVGRALDTHVLLAIHRLLNPYAAGFGESLLGVGEKIVVQVELVNELRVRLGRVWAHANHLGALELRHRVAKLASFDRATARVILRIEENDGRTPLQIVKGDGRTGLIGKRETRERLAFGDHILFWRSRRGVHQHGLHQVTPQKNARQPIVFDYR